MSSESVLKSIRHLQHSIDYLENIKSLELPGIQTKSHVLIEQNPDEKDYIVSLVENLKEQVDEKKSVLDDWKKRLTEFSKAQNNFNDDNLFVLKLLDTTEKLISSEWIQKMSDERLIIAKLRQGRDQLELAQERANKLKRANLS